MWNSFIKLVDGIPRQDAFNVFIMNALLFIFINFPLKTPYLNY